MTATTRTLAPVGLAIAGIVLMAVCMRGPITSVGPLLERIRDDTGLSAAGAGVLSMLPLLAFAAVSPVAPGFARRIGLERSLVTAIGALAVGLGAEWVAKDGTRFIGA